jgi:exodeoxyribonuclease VII large subunit
MDQEVIVEVSDAVALFNQTFDYAYPSITIVGELANFRISRNKWVYFDLKDDYALLKFFGTIYNLPGPLEEGMKLAVKGRPHVHEQYGFSVQVQSITPVGQGAIKKAADLLAKKLTAEGLFDPTRKRPLPYPPQTIGLITSAASAAYADFIKVLGARYGGVQILSYDTQVQGELAIADIIGAIKYFNELADVPDVLVLTRGGGSAEDLAAFSHEHVVRAVAASRIPTLVAIGHEVDLSLAELAADARASTPSNAAELLVPDKRDLQSQLQSQQKWLLGGLLAQLTSAQNWLKTRTQHLDEAVAQYLKNVYESLDQSAKLLEVLSPNAALKRGYAIVRSGNKIITTKQQAKPQQLLDIQLSDGSLQARVE